MIWIMHLGAASHTGYMLHLRPERAEVFEKCVAACCEFEEPVPRYNQAPLLCFVSAQVGVITHVARRVPRLRKYAGTGLSLITCQRARALPVPVALAAIVRVVRIRAREDFGRRLQGGFLPEASCQAMLDAIITLAPQVEPILRELLAPPNDLDVPGPVKERWGLERDGLAFLFELAGFDRGDLSDWDVPDLRGDFVPSYFAGLRKGRLLEPDMVLHDAHRFPGFAFVEHDATRGIEFVRNGHKLRVFFADKTKLELDGGMDLLYFNEAFSSFVAVQYKVIDTAYYPDDQFQEQVLRMKKMAATLRQAAALHERRHPVVNDFRISEDPFFFKFCNRIASFDPKSDQMIRGMYVPLPLWEVLVASGVLEGLAGSELCVRNDNIPRYFDNTHFIELVRNAWVGSSPGQYAAAAEMVRYIKDTGRSWIVAYHSQLPTKQALAQPGA